MERTLGCRIALGILLRGTFGRFFPPLFYGDIGLIAGPYAIGEYTGCCIVTFVVHGGRAEIAEGVDVDFAVSGRTVVVVFVAWAEEGLGDACGYEGDGYS